jgi:hypothetical protein
MDEDKDGWLEFHFDCPENPFKHELDPKHVAAAKRGVHGAKLRALITKEN